MTESLEMFARLLTLAGGMAVVLACICRINLMTPSTHKLSWRVMYLLLATYGFGTALQALAGEEIKWHQLAGVAGLVLFIVISKRSWHGTVPRGARKGMP